ncbi:MAG: N-acetyltransferase [Oxalobacteraceae bacterium]|nr:MAG: N-acetyltransferase [Oxalobacteraceae bacterium]
MGDSAIDWLSLLAEWENANGTLAWVADSEQPILISRIQNLAVKVSPRTALAAISSQSTLLAEVRAERDGVISGHIAFSPVEINGQSVDWYGLGPVAVKPDQQRQGVGTRLIEAGLDEIKALGARGCVVLGDPAYYGRFGFHPDASLQFPGVPQEYFQRLAFSDDKRDGVVRYHSAFYGE